nr:hypothetical protein [uncultured Psychroserpens sp.]
MKKTLKNILLVLMVIPLLCSCDEDDSDLNLREAPFTVTFLNRSNQSCNGGQLSFTFLITFPDGTQVTQTLEPGAAYEKFIPLVRDRESINVKIFFPSVEEAIAEANIPFIFSDEVSDEDLEPIGNELSVTYCHSLTNGVRWDIFY